MPEQDELDQLITEKGWQKLNQSEAQWSYLAELRQGAWVQLPSHEIGYFVIASWEKASNEVLAFHLAQAAGYERPFISTEKISRNTYLFFSQAAQPAVQTLQQIGKNITPEIAAATADTISSCLPFDLLMANADLHEENLVIVQPKPEPTDHHSKVFGYRVDYGFASEGERVTTMWILSQWRDNFDRIAKHYKIKLGKAKIEEGIGKIESLSDAAIETCIAQTAALDPEQFSHAQQAKLLSTLIKRRPEIRHACSSKVLARRFG